MSIEASASSATTAAVMLWSERDDLEELHGDPLAIWASWAPNLTGHSIDSGHHMAEDAPGPLTAALATFLTANVV